MLHPIKCNAAGQPLQRDTAPNVAHSLASYRTIRDRIIALEEGIDEETLADTLEGLTDLHEVVAAVVRSALVDEALAEGLKGHIGVLKERFDRLSDRAKKRREIARDAMIEVDIKKVTAPDFTVSVRSGSPSLVVTDEGTIPAPYWLPRDPRLDRSGLLSDLKSGKTVVGATLSNPEPVISVRVR
ncbi:siphovirus Gp157 family protein [Bauldia litoralis]|uniref:siphovirus Gp157 family protein n=1 Tax=Bauldia litoralis TaxID=665467 RepID=UPI003266277B